MFPAAERLKNVAPGASPGYVLAPAPRRLGGPRSASATARSLKKIDRRYSKSSITRNNSVRGSEAVAV